MNSRVFHDFMQIVARDTAMREQLRLAGSSKGIGFGQLAEIAASKGFPFKGDVEIDERPDGRSAQVADDPAASTESPCSGVEFDPAGKRQASVFSTGGAAISKY
jgi:hypothetical protein